MNVYVCACVYMLIRLYMYYVVDTRMWMLIFMYIQLHTCVWSTIHRCEYTSSCEYVCIYTYRCENVYRVVYVLCG